MLKCISRHLFGKTLHARTNETAAFAKASLSSESMLSETLRSVRLPLRPSTLRSSEPPLRRCIARSRALQAFHLPVVQPALAASPRRLSTGNVGRPVGKVRPIGDVQPVMLPDGTMQQPGDIPVHPFLQEVLRGMGQVVFCSSTLTGGFVTAGLLYADPRLAILSLVGCASGTAIARFIPSLAVEAAAIHKGHMGYNGALIGCAFGVFLLAPKLVVLTATLVGGAASALVASRLGKLISPLPQLTLACNMISLSVLGVTRPLIYREAVGEQISYNEFDTLDWLGGLLSGLSQIFLLDSPIAGGLIAFGIFTYSPLAAVATLAGSALGMFTAWCANIDPFEVMGGLWGYNPSLTALAVSVLFVPLGPPFIALACISALVASGVNVAMKNGIGSIFNAPALTWPFCIVTTVCCLLGGRLRGLVLAKRPHSPEANLKAFQGL